MVIALDSISNSLGSSSGWGTVLCSWARHFTLTMPLFTQVYKWVLVNLLLGVTLRWTSIPSSGGEEILLATSCYRNWDKLPPDGLFCLEAGFTLYLKTSCCTISG